MSSKRKRQSQATPEGGDMNHAQKHARTSSAPKSEDPTDVPDSVQDICRKVFESIRHYKDASGRLLAEPYLVIPPKSLFPDYDQVIKRPIALNAIKARLEAGKYKTVQLFRDEIELVFENAKTYNQPQSRIYRDALFLQNKARKEIDDAVAAANAKDLNGKGAGRKGKKGTATKDIENLISAIELDDKPKIQAILDKDVDLNTLVEANLFGTRFTWSPLHAAAYFARDDIIHELIARGADLELSDTWYQSRPLGWAAYAGNISTSRMLVDKYDADTTFRNVGNQTALDMVATPDDAQWKQIFAKRKGVHKKKRKDEMSQDDDENSESHEKKARRSGSAATLKLVLSEQPRETPSPVDAHKVKLRLAPRQEQAEPVIPPTKLTLKLPTVDVPSGRSSPEKEDATSKEETQEPLHEEPAKQHAAQNGPNQHEGSQAERQPPNKELDVESISSDEDESKDKPSLTKNPVMSLPVPKEPSIVEGSATPAVGIATPHAGEKAPTRDTDTPMRATDGPFTDVNHAARQRRAEASRQASLVSSLGIVSNDDHVRMILPVTARGSWHGHSMQIRNQVRSLNLRLLLLQPEGFTAGNAKWTVAGTQTIQTVVNGVLQTMVKPMKFVQNGTTVHDALAHLDDGVNAFEFVVSLTIMGAANASKILTQRVCLFMNRI
ncbi:hypothetical protein HDU85_002812 [Gaertneriomyces sp. JEL0708]|nr:hypothetical protein HDU85_002812 [Gaertneriomyces sp. JEL0708]